MLYIQNGIYQKEMQSVKQDSFKWLSDKIKAPDFATNKETGAGYFISGKMKSLERKEKNVIERDLMILDFDGLQKYKLNNQIITHEIFKNQIQDKLANYDYLLYPTYSASETKINYRVVIKLARPLNKTEYDCIGWLLVHQLQLPVDTSTLDWGRIQGVPVQSPTNKQILPNSVINNVNTPYPVANFEQLEENGVIERAKAIKRELMGHTSPKKDHRETFKQKEYNQSSYNQNGYKVQFLDDMTALGIIRDYTKVDSENLENYKNFVSTMMQLVAFVQRGEISEDAGRNAIEILAGDNTDWIDENVKKFEREIRNNTEVKNQDYTFIRKFISAPKSDWLKQKYRHLLPTRTPEQIHSQSVKTSDIRENKRIEILEEIQQADLTKYSYSTVPKEWLSELTDEQIKKLIGRDSAKNSIQALRDKIKASLNERVIKTGFPLTDKLLSGGLRAGLYFNGAISSLGKTTLIMQMADNIAKQGIPVIIFSLEMSKLELMAKSISRLTYEISVEDKKVLRPKMKQGDKPKYNALNYYQITDAKNHKYFTEYQKELLEKAFQRYETFAGNILLYEGVGDITAQNVRDTVKEVVERTGQKPAVFIDYLQVLAPEIERGSDKQNTDRAVLHLKQMSRDYDIPVVAISNLNRTNYSTAMNMTAFKESGAIEYSSDILLGMQLSAIRDKKEDKNGKIKINIEAEKRKEPRLVELKMMKQRNGRSSGSIDFKFMASFNHFEEIGEVKEKETTDENSINELFDKISNTEKVNTLTVEEEPETIEEPKKEEPAGEQQTLNWFGKF